MEIKELNINDDAYAELVKSASVFNFPQWLKIYGPSLKLFGLFNNDNKLFGAFYWYTETRIAIKRLRVPPYSPHCGLFFSNPAQNRSSINSFNKEVKEKLVDFFDSSKKNLLTLAFPTSIVDLQSFTWKGYKVIPNYTYQINLAHSNEEIFKEFDSKNRNLINKVEKENYEIKPLTDKKILFEFLQQSLLAAKANVYESILKAIVFDFINDQNSFTYALKDASGNISSAVLCLYDDKACYYLLAGNNREHMINGANNLLVYKSILKAKELGCKIFDFEGSMIPGVEKFFRSFGGSLVPYYTINKGSFLVETVLKLKLPSTF